jgi:hypothetical protein
MTLRVSKGDKLNGVMKWQGDGVMERSERRKGRFSEAIWRFVNGIVHFGEASMEMGGLFG